MSFYTQSRSAFVLLLLQIVCLEYYLNSRRLPRRFLFTLITLVVLAFSFLYAIRYSLDPNLTEFNLISSPTL